jgi:hypothetical protein
MADDGTIDTPSPQDVLAAQQAQIQQGIGAPSPFQRNSALGTMLGRTLFGNPQLQQANAIQNGLKSGASGAGTQQDGESDVDYTLRKLKAQRDAVADISPQLAAQLNTQILTLGQKKFENSRLQASDTRQQTLFEEGQPAAKAEAANALAQNRTYVLTPDKTSPQGYAVKAFDMTNPDDAASFKDAAAAPNAQVMSQAQAAQLFKGTDVQSLKDQTKLASSAFNQPGAVSPLELNLAAADVLVNPGNIRNYVQGKSKDADNKRAQIQTQIAKNLDDAGMKPSDINALRANAAAYAKSLPKAVMNYQNVQAADQLAQFNGQRVMELVDKVNTSKYSSINSLKQAIAKHSGDVSGDDAAEYASTLNAFQTEAAKILTGPASGGGVLSDSARQELQQLVNGTLAPSSVKRVITRMFTEFDFRKRSLQGVVSAAGEDIDSLSQMRPATATFGGAPPPAAVPNAAPPQANNVDALVSKYLPKQ